MALSKYLEPYRRKVLETLQKEFSCIFSKEESHCLYIMSHYPLLCCNTLVVLSLWTYDTSMEHSTHPCCLLCFQFLGLPIQFWGSWIIYWH